MRSGDKVLKKPLIIGVTGVIGSGKSTLCKFLQSKGFYWINADKIVHELYRKGEDGYKKIKKHFGKEFVDEKGVIRDKLREFALRKPDNILVLNRLIHPLVLRKVNKKVVQLKRPGKPEGLAKGKKTRLLICIEAVYFDADYLGKIIDQVIAVDASNKVIFHRLKKRNIPKQELKTLIKFQRENIKSKGLVIKNNRTEKDLYKRADIFLRSLITLFEFRKQGFLDQ